MRIWQMCMCIVAAGVRSRSVVQWDISQPKSFCVEQYRQPTYFQFGDVSEKYIDICFMVWTYVPIKCKNCIIANRIKTLFVFHFGQSVNQLADAFSSVFAHSFLPIVYWMSKAFYHNFENHRLHGGWGVGTVDSEIQTEFNFLSFSFALPYLLWTQLNLVKVSLYCETHLFCVCSSSMIYKLILSFSRMNCNAIESAHNSQNFVYTYQ